VFIRRVLGIDITAYRLSKSESVLLALLSEARTMSKLMEMAPSDIHLLEARIERLVRLGLIERVSEAASSELDETLTWRPVPPHAVNDLPSKVGSEPRDSDEAVTLRPPSIPIASPTSTPSTGVHSRPTRTIRSPFENVPVRQKAR
jgi:hypothetical protein